MWLEQKTEGKKTTSQQIRVGRAQEEQLHNVNSYKDGRNRWYHNRETSHTNYLEVEAVYSSHKNLTDIYNETSTPSQRMNTKQGRERTELAKTQEIGSHRLHAVVGMFLQYLKALGK